MTFGGLPLESVNQAGQRIYLNPYSGRYTTKRDYGLRMQRGYARGLPWSEARGQGVRAGRTESQRRRERLSAQGLTQSQQYSLGFEARYGFSLSYWRRLRSRYISEINQTAWPQAGNRPMQFRIDASGAVVRDDPRVFPSDITAAKQLYDQGYRDPMWPNLPTWQDWIEHRLYERLSAIRDYHGLTAPEGETQAAKGQADFAQYRQSTVWFNVTPGFGGATAPPIELWWYH